MKRFFLFLGYFFTANILAAQTAADWSLNDCNANPHQLYSYLDNNEVVVMEFAMGCASCTNAASRLMSLKSQYDASHPGRVKFFYMDYWPANTCTEVTASAAPYNFDAVFSGCLAQKDEYFPTMEPMPAIVVAAGHEHRILFEHNTWYHSDTALIKQAIDDFLAGLGEPAVLAEQGRIYPNPAHETVALQLPASLGGEVSYIALYTLSGAMLQLFNQPASVGNTYQISLQGVQPGLYFIEWAAGGKLMREKLSVY